MERESSRLILLGKLIHELVENRVESFETLGYPIGSASHGTLGRLVEGRMILHLAESITVVGELSQDLLSLTL